MKIKQVLNEWRLILMFTCLIISIIIINPNFDRSGVLVTSVDSPYNNYLSSDLIKLILFLFISSASSLTKWYL